jgi:hypothetical protein
LCVIEFSVSFREFNAGGFNNSSEFSLFEIDRDLDGYKTLHLLSKGKKLYSGLMICIVFCRSLQSESNSARQAHRYFLFSLFYLTTPMFL